ncbi:MAG: acetyl-CoA carboxylase, biotin carboxyl carrier protein [Bacillaceae bacterium G1]|nr:MAG: acetyl-CoA carboxylase, biotin carboxyl carrier protein [Bacillaceae bacterium G1]
MRLHELKDLIRFIDESSITEFKYEQDDFKVELKKSAGVVVASAPQTPVVETKPAEAAVKPAPAPTTPPTTPAVEAKAAPAPSPAAPTPAPTPAAVEQDENLHQIVSPMVGTFYRAPAPDAPPYVEVGSIVNEKTVVCIVEAMKLFNEIEAECNGEIVAIHAENGQLVEFGQPLFTVRLTK